MFIDFLFYFLLYSVLELVFVYRLNLKKKISAVYFIHYILLSHILNIFKRAL